MHSFSALSIMGIYFVNMQVKALFKT